MPTRAQFEEVVERWVCTTRELLHDDRRRFLEIMGKVVLARALHGFSPGAFFMAELHERPLRTWRDHSKDSDDYWAGVHALNWSAGGRELARDKVLASERCAAHGVPHAPILAVVGRDTVADSSEGRFPSARSAAELLVLLADAPDQVIVKPAGGLHGEGVVAAERTPGGWRLDGETLTDGAFAERLVASSPPEGLLVQPRLDNHPELAALMVGSGLATVRVIVALTPDGPNAFVASLKILGGESVTDNFVGGRTGNLLAALDVPSGRIVRVHGRRPGRRIVLYTTDTHPVSGVPLVGRTVPLWADLIELAERAAAAFPEIPLASLDIAVTPDGPLFVETNTEMSSAMQLSTLVGVRTTLRRIWPTLEAPTNVKLDAARRFRL